MSTQSRNADMIESCASADEVEAARKPVRVFRPDEDYYDEPGELTEREIAVMKEDYARRMKWLADLKERAAS
jgi:hypothetical protein